MRRLLLIPLVLLALAGAPGAAHADGDNLGAASRPGTGQVDICVIQADHSAAHWPEFGQVAGWDQLGGWLSSIQCLWFDGNQNFMVLGVGLDGNLWYRSYGTATGTWNGWAPIAPFSPPTPAVTILP